MQKKKKNIKLQDVDEVEEYQNKNNGKKNNKEKVKVKAKKTSKKSSTKKIKKKSGKACKILLLILIIAVLCVGIFLWKRIKDNGGGITGIVATIIGHDASTLQNLEELRFVVIGQSQTLTDTIMVCSYNPRSQKASILSIPRDTFTGKNKNTASAYNKINTLYQQSPEKLLAQINEMTGLNVKYYVHVDTEGLKELVDAIGGVYFDVPINMKYDDYSQNLHIDLKAGYQLLDGNQAEQLVRFRHNNNGSTYSYEYGQEDIGRMKTQQEFLKAVIKKMAKAENITKIDDYIAIANKNIETNIKDLNILKDYAPYALSFNIDNVRTETLPGVSEKCNELWFYICNKKKTTELVNEMFSLEPVDEVTITDVEDTEESSSTTTSTIAEVEILNGSSQQININDLKSKLQKAGFKVLKTTNTTETAKTTIISRTNKSEEIVNKLKDTLGAGTVSNGNNNAGVDFTIVIGNDFSS